MAERLDDYNFPGARQDGSQFDGFVDGGIYRIVVGEDVHFHTLHSARQSFYKACRRVGKRGRIHTAGPLTIVVQAVEVTS